jgi:hypothetical protein
MSQQLAHTEQMLEVLRHVLAHTDAATVPSLASSRDTPAGADGGAATRRREVRSMDTDSESDSDGGLAWIRLRVGVHTG